MKYLLAAIMMIGFYSGCKKKQPDLPEAGHEGANMLACRINGENFIVHGAPNIFADQFAEYVGPTYGGADSGFHITGRSESPNDRQVDLQIKPYRTAKTIYAMGPSAEAYGSWAPWTSNGQLAYSTNVDQSGVITLNYTPNDGILSGTFSFDGYDSSTHETVHVTDGRFDIAP